MFIEIRGVGFVNKGAELMLRAVLQHYEGREDLRFAVSSYTGTYEQRARLGLYTRISISRHRPRSWLIPLVMPRAYHRQYGLVSWRDIAVVLDASGYAYGDPWGSGPALDAVRDFAQARKNGSRIILLPQALGPFESPAVRQAFLRIKDQVDLVYARDRGSYRHAVSCGGRCDHVSLAPDITHLVAGRIPPGGGLPPRAAAVVPNSMVLRADSGLASAYISLLATVCRRLKEAGFSPVLLLHEEKRDRELVARLYDGMGHSLPSRYESDPVFLKGLLGQAEVVFASRFHALVSALSQAVPSIAVGWAHKYDELFADYEIPEFCLGLRDRWERAIDLIDMLADPGRRMALRQKLQTRADANRQKAEKMWKEVDHLLFG